MSMIMKSLEISTQRIFSSLIKQTQKLSSNSVLNLSTSLSSVQSPASRVQRQESRTPRPGSSMQFHWQLETTNSRFWLVNILLRKFDTSSKRKKMITTNFMMKNNKDMSKKNIKVLNSFFFMDSPIDRWWNILQTVLWGRGCFLLVLK